MPYIQPDHSYRAVVDGDAQAHTLIPSLLSRTATHSQCTEIPYSNPLSRSSRIREVHGGHRVPGNAKWNCSNRTSERMASSSPNSVPSLRSPSYVSFLPLCAIPAPRNLCRAVHRADKILPLNVRVARVRMRSPIEQHMLSLYRQKNIEKRKAMSVREWCAEDDLHAPGVNVVEL